VLVRSFDPEWQLGESTSRRGRVLTGRFVPYDTVALVADDLPSGKRDIYEEGFRRGAFAIQAGTKEPGVLSRIKLRHCHDGTGLGFLGTTVALREQPDGLWGDVSIVPSREPDVERLLTDGVNELSIEFRVRAAGGTLVDANGVKWRTAAQLDGVALEARGAYRKAQVLAFRAELDDAERAEHEAAAAAAAATEAEQTEAALKAEAEAAEAAERQRAEAEAEAAAQRRREWDELTGTRLEAERVKQIELVRTYGLVVPARVPHHA
jgi:hypothetical protein